MFLKKEIIIETVETMMWNKVASACSKNNKNPQNRQKIL